MAEDAVDFVAVDAVGLVVGAAPSFLGAVRAGSRALGFDAFVLVAGVGVLIIAGDFVEAVALTLGFVEMALGRFVTFLAADGVVVDCFGVAVLDFGLPLEIAPVTLSDLGVAVAGSAGRRPLAGCSSSICLSGFTLG